MTDEQITALVARLRSNRPLPTLPHEAADLIDTQAAEIARLRERLTQAIERLRDMLKGDDGQAWDEAQRFVDIAQETQS
jgi:ABC-type transporter Mla subunit MlaD